MKKNLLTRIRTQGVQNASIAKSFMPLYCFMLIALTVGSCKKDFPKDQSFEKNSGKDEILYNRLIKAGFKIENIKDVGGAYLIEGDFRFLKFKTDLIYFDEYFQLSEKKNDTASVSQFTTNAKVSSENVERIKIFNAPHLGDRALAVTNWANISNSKVNFYPGTLTNNSHNSITFLDDPNLSGAYAEATFPSNDSPGFKIRINPSAMASISASQRLFILTHEVGHCLGFRHSDMLYSSNSSQEINAPEGYNLVPGTPDFDTYSVMNSAEHFSTVPNWSGFSFYDEVAARNTYPFRPYDKWITYPDGKYPNGTSVVIDYDLEIKWNPNLVSTSTVSIEAFQYGQSKGIVAANIVNDGSVILNPWSFLNDDGGGFNDVQIKIISDSNPSIADFSIPFYITY